MTPEAKARQTIDTLLAQAGWHVCNVADANIHAARGVAIREFSLNTGFGFADDLLYIDAKAAGHFLELNYEEMRKVASGGVQPNLNLSLVRAVAVPLPPLAEQVRIVAEVDRCLSLVRGVESQVDANLKRGQVLRQSVLGSCFQSMGS